MYIYTILQFYALKTQIPSKIANAIPFNLFERYVHGVTRQNIGGRVIQPLRAIGRYKAQIIGRAQGV